MRLLCRRGWRREFGLRHVHLVLLAALGCSAPRCWGARCGELTALSRRLPDFFAALAGTLDTLRERLGSAAAAAPPELTQWIALAENSLLENLAAVPARLSAWL